jgi:hypothetical protein
MERLYVFRHELRCNKFAARRAGDFIALNAE